jgi:FemAB-related protein (PEP-CTERM system-associated)
LNAPFVPARTAIRLIEIGDPVEMHRLEVFVAQHPHGTPFHRPAWLSAVATGSGNRALALVAEQADALTGYLPLLEVHSPLFGRVMVSSGFGVDGGMLVDARGAESALFAAVEELALRRSCPAIELRGGILPQGRLGWKVRHDTHCGFVAELAKNVEAQLLAIPRKQRAEVRKGLANPLEIAVGNSQSDRAAHYAVYAESVRNLGTPVFPRALFDEVLDSFGDDADILTVRADGAAVASVLSLYHQGAVMPYWGGGTQLARRLRANDRMYFELMLHAERRGCTRFDFGRSKTGSGAYDFKRSWGFEPRPLGYASWTAPGASPRDADPTSAKHAARIALWRKLPLALANRLGPLIARGLA